MPGLGKTGLVVSSLCFGTLALSTLQGYRDPVQAARVLRYGLDQGINFLDTAEIYLNYDLIRTALKGFNGEVTIATKSYAYTKEQMAKSLDRARQELHRDVIEIFLLHEQESMHTLHGHREALDFLIEAKTRGTIKAIGISTHAVAGMRAGAALPEIDVIHPILNLRGLGIIDGDLEQMLQAIELASQMGKGIYGMKALGGGHLGANPVEALDFARKVQGVSSVAVGMASFLEVDVNLRIFNETEIPSEWLQGLNGEKRMLHAADWCQGCANCLEKCPQEALYLEHGQVKVRRDKCVLCGYCAAACPHFCLKIVKQGV